MAEPALTKVSTGVNTKTWTPIYYVEARLTPKSPWRKVVSKGKWCVHRSSKAADREARSLQKRLRAKQQ